VRGNGAALTAVATNVGACGIAALSLWTPLPCLCVLRSTMPADKPQRRVDFMDIAELRARVGSSSVRPPEPSESSRVNGSVAAGARIALRPEPSQYHTR
jgi:hypothetical protein